MGQRTRYSAWREAEPKPRYDAIVIGGGGHGLATAYYLTKNQGVTNVAVLEAGWIGGGNTGRNTTIVRSNSLHPESARLYDFSLRQYEQLDPEISFNMMLQPARHGPAGAFAARPGRAIALGQCDAVLWRWCWIAGRTAGTATSASVEHRRRCAIPDPGLLHPAPRRASKA